MKVFYKTIAILTFIPCCIGLLGIILLGIGVMFLVMDVVFCIRYLFIQDQPIFEKGHGAALLIYLLFCVHLYACDKIDEMPGYPLT